MTMTYEATTLWCHDDLKIMRRDGDVIIDYSSEAVLMDVICLCISVAHLAVVVTVVKG